MIDFHPSIGEIGEITWDGDPLETMDQGDIDLRGTPDMDDVNTGKKGQLISVPRNSVPHGF
jgi:hypothetical protein